ncbi:MAG: tRNA pseudouridine(13) synthase TruD [Candidatus Hydrothermarchaeales archaeon]
MKSSYELDLSLGLDFFATDTPGIGGRLRTVVEDFEVEEMPLQIPVDQSGEYTHFTLEKSNWETIGAVKALARALGISQKRFGYAGSKDRRAVTRQRVAVWQVEPEQLAEIRIKDIKLYDFVKSNSRLSLGNSEGNSFKIVVRDARLRGVDVENELSETREQMVERGIPSYFGYQRFGVSRPNTHLVGRELVLGSLEGAVMRYLAFPYKTESEESQRARQYLEDTGDYRGALDVYPKKLGYERAMLDALSKNPRDYAGALRRLPKKLMTMLVHAYQSYLFNKLLSRVIEEEMFQTDLMLPLLGYRTKLEDALSDIFADILEEEGLSSRKFFIKSMPEVSAPGGVRTAGLEVVPDYDIVETNESSKVMVSFNLPTGCYATVVLRELMKTDPANW